MKGGQIGSGQLSPSAGETGRGAKAESESPASAPGSKSPDRGVGGEDVFWRKVMSLV